MAKPRSITNKEFVRLAVIAATPGRDSTAEIERGTQADALTREVQLWLQASRDECTESERLEAVKTHLREHALDLETLLHFASAGFLASDAVLVQTERAFEFAKLVAEGVADKHVRTLSENGGDGPEPTFSDEKLRKFEAEYLASHKGKRHGFVKAAAFEFQVTERQIGRRLKALQ